MTNTPCGWTADIRDILSIEVIYGSFTQQSDCAITSASMTISVYCCCVFIIGSRVLSLGDPYCQSTCLSVGLSLCMFVCLHISF